MKSHFILSLMLSLFLLPACSKPQKVSIETLKVLEEYEGAEYVLISAQWLSDGIIARTDNKIIAGKELLSQLYSLNEYSIHENGITIGRAVFDESNCSFHGQIQIAYPVQEFGKGSLSEHPSKKAIPFVFTSYYFPIPYTVSYAGIISHEDYSAPKGFDELDERGYLSCTIDSLSPETIEIVYSNILVPDFLTDSFLLGRVKMTYTRNN